MIMRTPSPFGRVIVYLSIAISIFQLPGCVGEGVSRSLGFNVDRGFSNVCTLGVYAVQCWTIKIEDQSIHVEATFDNPLLDGLPASDEVGHITGLTVEGKYTGEIKIRVSPTFMLGPPLCALSDPIDGPSIATTVVDFRVTGNYEWVWGDHFTDSNGITHRGVRISKSDLELERFDVHNLWSEADDELRKLFKNTIRRVIDEEVVKEMNYAACLGCSVPSNLPVYVEGYNPYEDGGFCE
jgi:hypothetical protein